MPCLGFLSGSFCPHYDGEKDRRPLYRRCVASGRISPGLGADDAAAVHYRDDGVHACLSGRPGARVYRVDRERDAAVETPLEMRSLLGAPASE